MLITEQRTSGPIAADEAVTTLRVKHRGPQPMHVSCGVGLDSVAVLVGLRKRGVRVDGVVFADTGAEWPETYDYLRKHLQPWLRKAGYPPVKVVRNPSPIAGDASLEAECLRKGMLPSISYYYKRSCSIKWKHAPIDAYIKGLDSTRTCWSKGYQVLRVIGFDASENRRFGKSHDCEKWRHWYPLVEWGWDRDECARQVEAAGLKVPRKSSCFFCAVSKPHEIEELTKKHPHLADRIIEMERRAAPNLTKIKGLWVEKRMTDFIKRVRRGVPGAPSPVDI